MKIKKLAAIDIGSNAVRLLISNVIESNQQIQFFKNSLVRVPIRLGEDSFTSRKISDRNINRLVKSMKSFRILMKVHDVKNYSAYATSALREAVNGNIIINRILEKTGVKVEIIDGEREAKIISKTDVFQDIDVEKTYLYVDVGGGSTEFSILFGGKRIDSISFKIGTVRLLNKAVDNKIWHQAENWIREKTVTFKKIYLLGTGGNINKLHKLANIKDNRPITYLKLSSIYNKLKSLTYEERIIKLGLNPDRSDVIILAAEIFLKTLQWSEAKVVYVPKMGLSDGMIRELYYNTRGSN